jgi:trimeric autotransporter adhesin
VKNLQRKLGLHFWTLIFASLILSACQQQINFPKPVLKSMTPTTIQAGNPVFTLHVMGDKFSPGSLVEWNGTPLPSIFIDVNHMTAQIPATLVQNPGTSMVAVFTTTPGGGTSATVLTFTITPAPSNVPNITSAAPNTVLAGSNGAAIVLSGSNFVSQSIVTVNNTNRPTGFINSTSLQVALSGGDLATAGTLQIAVINPVAPPPAPPNGGTSNLFPFPVVNPFPVITSLTPTGVAAGGTITTALTLTGTGFTATSVIELNGGPRQTAFVNSTSLSTQLSSGDIASAGVNQVQVVNSAPGGGTSNIAAFAVNPTTTLGLPVILDLAPDGSQAVNGICGTNATCANGIPDIDTAGPSTDNDGHTVAFASISNNLVKNDTNGASDIFVRTTCVAVASCTPTTTLISTDPNGNAANGASSEPTIDAGGSTVAFTSTASNLVTSAALNGATRQVFWQLVGPSSAVGTQLVSMAADGVSAGNGDSYNPVISPDARYVAFVSVATNLVSNATFDGVTPQVFIRDTCSGAVSVTCSPTTFLVSTPDGTTPGNKVSSSPSIASGALYVAFVSSARNLGPTAPNPNGLAEAFVRACPTLVATCAPETDLVSTPDSVTPANGASTQTAIMSTGRYIAFTSTGTNLGVSSGGVQEIYVRDSCLGVTGCTPSTSLVSTRDGVTPANSLAERPSFSSTGQFVAFASAASNLGANTANGIENVFARNTCINVGANCTAATIVASQPAGTLSPSLNGSSLAPSISGDGQTVSFLSFANNLVARDTNGVLDVFLASTTF